MDTWSREKLLFVLTKLDLYGWSDCIEGDIEELSIKFDSEYNDCEGE